MKKERKKEKENIGGIAKKEINHKEAPCNAIATFKQFIRAQTIMIDARIRSNIDKVADVQQEDCTQIYSDLRSKSQKNAMLMHNMKRWLKELDETMRIEKHVMCSKTAKKMSENASKITKEIVLNFCCNRKFEIECCK